MTTAPAKSQKDAFETNRKLSMVLEFLNLQAAMRARAGAFGRVVIELTWDRGAIKRVKITDETIIEDLSDKERELILRATAVDRPVNSKQPQAAPVGTSA